MLKLAAAIPSYCSMCSRPAQVGLLDVTGWQHRVPVCASCLRDLASAIERGGPSVNGVER